MSTSAQIAEVERREWLEQRLLGIGGSDCAAVFSEGYGCARALAYEKLEIPEDFPRTERENRILRRGTLMEELVADEYALVTGRKIRRMPTRVSKQWPWMRVNVDRAILNDPRGPGVLEVKTASPWIYREMTVPDSETGIAKGLPTQYVLQMNHAFAVTGYTWGAFAVMNATTWELLSFEIARNEELIAEIVAREETFWKHVKAEVLPEPLEKHNDRRCASCRWRHTCRGESVIIPEDDRELAVDDSLAELASDYAEAEDKIEVYESARREIREKLEAAIADRPGVLIPSVGYKIVWKQEQGRHTFDSKALQSLIEGFRHIGADPIADQIERCRKVGPATRPFRFKRVE